jgi:integrase
VRIRRAGISRLHHTEKEHEPWPAHVIKAFDVAAKPKINLARLLAYYTGQRRSDLVEMNWQRFNGKTIEVRQVKTDELLEIPCHKVLRAALEAIPESDRTGTILKTSRRNSRKYSAQGLAEAFRRTLRKVGAKGYSIHGLRKNAAKALADAGCTDREIMAITGHKTAAMVTKYTRRADQLRRAKRAVAKWEEEDEGMANREQKEPEEWLPSLKSNEK